jgi:hypothetical protein
MHTAPVRRGFVLAAVAVALIGAVFVAQRESPAPASTATVVPAADEAPPRVPRNVPKPASLDPATTALAPEVARIDAELEARPGADFVAARAELERQADAGDVASQVRAGLLLLECDGYANLSDGELDALASRILARPADSMPVFDSVPHAASVALARDRTVRKRALCADSVGMQVSRRDQERARDWLRAAAAAGDVEAMAAYAKHAFLDSDDGAQMIANPQAVRERKREARDYLDRALAAGSVQAFEVASQTSRYGVLMEKSDYMAYVYFYVYRQARVGLGADPRALDPYLEALGSKLPPADALRAQAQGRAIHAACCTANAGSRR